MKPSPHFLWCRINLLELFKERGVIPLLFLCLLPGWGLSQNLVLNPGFEEEDPNRPIFYWDRGAKYWTVSTPGRSYQYYSDSAIDPGYRPPHLHGAFQYPRTGRAFVNVLMLGFNCGNRNHECRSEVTGELKDTLQKDMLYHVRMHVNLKVISNSSNAISDVGLQFYKEHIFLRDTYLIDLNSLPHIANPPDNYLDDTAGWMTVSGLHRAEGWEKVFIISNFAKAGMTNHLPILLVPQIYYHFDDISVQTLQLGPDTSICHGDQIVLRHYFNFDDAVILWSDGSTGDSLVVDSPGTYWCNVTIDGHTFTDSIVVDGSGYFSFQLPQDTVLCHGSNLNITLPDGPDYMWQDGQTEPDYVISQSGRYSVTATQGSCKASGEVFVRFEAEPQNILPDSILLCTGQSVTLNVGHADGSLLWDNGSTGKERQVSTGGTYSVTITNACGLPMKP